MTDEQTAELERLEAAATPGPWENEGISTSGRMRGGRPNGEVILRHDPNKLYRFDIDELSANQQLVPAMRNALPEFIAEIRAHRDSMKPMTPEQAQAELDAAPYAPPMSEADIQRVVKFCKDQETLRLANALLAARAENAVLRKACEWYGKQCRTARELTNDRKLEETMLAVKVLLDDAGERAALASGAKGAE